MTTTSAPSHVTGANRKTTGLGKGAGRCKAQYLLHAPADASPVHSKSSKTSFTVAVLPGLQTACTRQGLDTSNQSHFQSQFTASTTNKMTAHHIPIHTLARSLTHSLLRDGSRRDQKCKRTEQYALIIQPCNTTTLLTRQSHLHVNTARDHKS